MGWNEGFATFSHCAKGCGADIASENAAGGWFQIRFASVRRALYDKLVVVGDVCMRLFFLFLLLLIAEINLTDLFIK